MVVAVVAALKGKEQGVEAVVWGRQRPQILLAAFLGTPPGVLSGPPWSAIPFPLPLDTPPRGPRSHGRTGLRPQHLLRVPAYFLCRDHPFYLAVGEGQSRLDAVNIVELIPGYRLQNLLRP